MTLREQLLVLSDGYRAVTGLSVSRLSTILFNDGKALSRISEGSDVHTRTWERAVAWFRENWPKGADWPGSLSAFSPGCSTAGGAGEADAAAGSGCVGSSETAAAAAAGHGMAAGVSCRETISPEAGPAAPGAGGTFSNGSGPEGGAA
ncbi:hypothetical protein [Afifella sp. IM 167]|uniref:hypothetical protein n=1 Tax=Afifella sp. IM 167 TaxID=2033586 RepID=UPI001CC915F9|nr:hypothetical protein [Afifella sp. IM 167]